MDPFIRFTQPAAAADDADDGDRLMIGGDVIAGGGMEFLEVLAR